MLLLNNVTIDSVGTTDDTAILIDNSEVTFRDSNFKNR